VPYDSLRRIDEIDLDAAYKLFGPDSRVVDSFVHWNQQGYNTHNWYLRIRHPVIGRFLSRTIDPLEGDVPYKPLLPVLSRLTTKEDDIWFANSLVARVGKSFKRRAQKFSLEIDTPVQRAARAIFKSIPEIVKQNSRLVLHHEARYHMHVLHACLDALDNPAVTTLSKDAIQTVLADEF
jgi:hypothetical protein